MELGAVFSGSGPLAGSGPGRAGNVGRRHASARGGEVVSEPAPRRACRC